MDKEEHICHAEHSWILDNWVRKLIQNPKKILGGYISKGMTVLDMGCGPGYFTIEAANLVGDSGKVIAVDLQQEMLDMVTGKIKGTGYDKRIILHKCEKDSIGIDDKVDFVILFWMAHEVPEKEKLFMEIKSILKPDGKILLSEPAFHVSKTAFQKTIAIAEQKGFKFIWKPKIFLSRARILGF